MSANSLLQQADILALLEADTRFDDVAIYLEAKGVTESEVDAALGARRVRGGKKGGLALIVTMPTEAPDPEQPDPILMTRRHVIRIIELPEVNRKSGGTQIEADTAKDYVLQRLHQRYLGKAALVWAGNVPWVDAKCGVGWEAAFDIRDDLPSELRAATPIITFAGLTCTIVGAGLPGEVLYYTTDGTAPVPGGATTQTYNAPFAVASLALVRAASVATGRELSDFNQETAPEEEAESYNLTTDGGDQITTDGGDPITVP